MSTDVEQLKAALEAVRSRQVAAVKALGGQLTQDATLYDVLAFMKDPGLVEPDASDSPEQGGTTADPTKIGYRVTLNTVGTPMDLSFCQGTYVLTQQTASCTGLGRVYRNTSGASPQTYMYVFSNDNWGVATDDSNPRYCLWMISDMVGNNSDVSFYMTNNLTSVQDTPDKVEWHSIFVGETTGSVQAVTVG